jgi:hypothetical protein
VKVILKITFGKEVCYTRTVSYERVSMKGERHSGLAERTES